jgi:hypothetical protein
MKIEDFRMCAAPPSPYITYCMLCVHLREYLRKQFEGSLFSAGTINLLLDSWSWLKLMTSGRRRCSRSTRENYSADPWFAVVTRSKVVQAPLMHHVQQPTSASKREGWTRFDVRTWIHRPEHKSACQVGVRPALGRRVTDGGCPGGLDLAAQRLVKVVRAQRPWAHIAEHQVYGACAFLAPM